MKLPHNLQSLVLYFWLGIGLGVLWSIYGIGGSVLAQNQPTPIARNSPIVILSDRYPSIPLGKYLEFLEDKTESWTIAEISSPAMNESFQASRQNPPGFGYTTSVYWARLQLDNPTSTDQTAILSLEHQIIDQISVYTPTPNSGDPWSVKATGLLYSFASREIPDRLPAFWVPLPAGSKQTIYLRFSTTSSLTVEASLGTPSAFWQGRAVTNFWLGIFYGIAIFAILYNLFLFTSLQDIGYLYYVGFVFGVTGCFIASDGFGLQYLWQNALWWNKHATFLILLPTVFLAFQWVSYFLQTKQHLPRYHYLLRLQQVVSLLLFAGFFYFPYRPMGIIGTLFLISTSFFCLLVGIASYPRGYVPLRYYLLSCLSLLVSLVIFQLSLLGIIPSPLWIREVPRIGLIAVMVFLSLALGDRINFLKAEKLEAQKLALQEKDLLHADIQIIQEQLLKREQKLEYDAFHDGLTGLHNRAWLMQHLEYLIQKKYPYAVLFIDLDSFNVINDSLGHLVGDKLLRHASLRLQSTISSNTTITRLGGDEFVFLLEDLTGLEEAKNLANFVQNQLQLPFKLQDYELFISASIGIALGNGEYQKPEEIIRDADLAMYQAKHKGKGCYEVFDPLTRQLALDRLNLERDLRQAIDQQEFCLYYQPIISFKTKEIKGFEALVRWQHPSGKMMTPDQFISIAEETGLINPLGWWILREACQQTQIWQQRFFLSPHLFVNVNISPIQLKQRDFVQKIQQILQETGLSGHYLKLEITESCLLKTVDFQEESLNQLRDLGIKLCIDDFGTGYSSLSRLHELPINTLKIDRSFVQLLEANNTEIIKTIVALAHSLNINTVAEGVETLAQSEKLTTLGCQFGQGYLFSYPLDEQSLTQLLAATIPLMSNL